MGDGEEEEEAVERAVRGEEEAAKQAVREEEEGGCGKQMARGKGIARERVPGRL